MEPAEHLSHPQYRQFVALVAHQHECRLVGIDFGNGTIELTGEEQAVHSCSRELKRLLGLAKQRAARA